MPRYLLQHAHRAEECAPTFAAFSGHDSPLRHQPTIASCVYGGHAIWWDVVASDEGDALRLLPFYVARRTAVTAISDVHIP